MVALFLYLCVYQWLIEDRPLSTIVNFAYERQFGIGQIYPGLLLVLAIMITIHQLFKKEHLSLNFSVLTILLIFLMLFSSRLSILVLLLSFKELSFPILGFKKKSANSELVRWSHNFYTI